MGGSQRPSRMSSRTAPGKAAKSARSPASAGRPADANSESSKKASRSAIEATVKVGVDPLEVEHQAERFARSNISKYRPARVEGEALHSLWQAIGQAFLDGAAVPHGRKIVGAYPTPSVGLPAKIAESRLERLERRIGVTIIVNLDLVEIEQATLDGQIPRPIVRIAPQDQALPWLHVSNDVGTRPDRRLERRIVEVLDIRAMLRQHGHHGERQRHFAVEPAKIEANRHKIERFRPFDPTESITLLRPTLLLEKIEGEQHVGCAHRYAVRKPCPRVEAEDDVGTGIVGLDRLGDQAIECERFIEGAKHQRLEYVADETLCRGPRTQVIRIETVERPLVGERQMASFRRLRIGVGKAREIGVQRRLAMKRNGGGG